MTMLAKDVGETTLFYRTGGAPSLALGMAHIFARSGGGQAVIGFWYHFAIMFEALFILTTIDTGTRVGRFLLQEFIGRFYEAFSHKEWLPGSIVATIVIVTSWSYFIWTGSINTIWPMFGIANQLLASVALAVGTTIIINMGRARYAWITAMPLGFVSVTTLTAGVLSIRDNFWPMAISHDASRHFQGYLNVLLTIIMMVCVLVILTNALWRCAQVLRGRLAIMPDTVIARSHTPPTLTPPYSAASG
jgi:carbon starvation protein